MGIVLDIVISLAPTANLMSTPFQGSRSVKTVVATICEVNPLVHSKWFHPAYRLFWFDRTCLFGLIKYKGTIVVIQVDTNVYD